MSNLKVYGLLLDNFGSPELPILTIAENRDQALLDFFQSDSSDYTFTFDALCMPTHILRYAYDHRSDLYEQNIIDESHWTMAASVFDPPLVDPKYIDKVGNWVLQHWGIDLGDIKLFDLEDDKVELIDGVFEIIRSKIFELPDHKQLSIAWFIFNSMLNGSVIEERSMTKAFVVNRLSKRHKDEMNQMRVDTVKVMRRNVPPELFDIVAGYLKS